MCFSKDGDTLWEQIIPEGIGLKLVSGINGEALMMWQHPDYPYFVVQKLDASGAGDAVVAWIDGDRKLYAQMLDASGKRLWGNEGILIAEGVCNQPVRLCGDKQGGFVIGWSTGWDMYQPNDSFVQKITAEGKLLWGERGIRVNP